MFIQLVAHDSSLRKLPARLDRKQLLFLDGIRQAAEIASLAYSRMTETLTAVALSEQPTDEFIRHNTTAAFLDAWAFVDAVDRFRTLWKQLPHDDGDSWLVAETEALDRVMQPIRNLRNVADHIAQRMDLVISRNSAALGVLSWFTATGRDPVIGFMCAIVPGTVTMQDAELLSPSGRSFAWPTGAVWLEEGGYKTCLCDVIPHIRSHIKNLESMVSSGNENLFKAEAFAPCDVLCKAFVRFDGS